MSGATTRGREARSSDLPPHHAGAAKRSAAGLRTRLVMLGMATLFACVAGQLGRLAASGGSAMVATLNEPMARSYVRPDILDRGGRLLATDIEMPSLYADPSLVQTLHEVTERLGTVLHPHDPRD